MIDETTKAPVADGDDEPKTEGDGGEPSADATPTPSRDSSGANLDISKKSVSKKCMIFFLILFSR